jgi:hypothetical protein
MKIYLVAAVVALTLALPASAAAKHKWWLVNYAKGQCEISPMTPEQVYDYAWTPASHLTGFSLDRISPDNVTKTAAGEIHVHITGVKDGNPVEMNYFTSKPECVSFIAEQELKPQQAPSADIN